MPEPLKLCFVNAIIFNEPVLTDVLSLKRLPKWIIFNHFDTGGWLIVKEIYITDSEREKCRKVADAFAELYEIENILVVDAGRYGFVKL